MMMMKKWRGKWIPNLLLSVAMMVSVLPVSALPVLAEEGNPVSEVDIDNPEYSRETVLEVDGEPFWYNGIQIRIDKLADNYYCSSTELQELFNQVAEDGFTVANSQIRWTDVQPNHEVMAVESAYIYGGANADKAYGGDDGIQVCYNAEDESKQALGYVKYTLDKEAIAAKGDGVLDGVKLRIYNRNKLKSSRKIKIYAITDDSWSKDTITWNNAPGHDGYNVKGTLVAESPDYDWMKAQTYYDFDVTKYIRTLEQNWESWDGTLSFIIQEEAVEGKTSDDPIVLGDFDDNNVKCGSLTVDGRPQFVYSDAEEFDFTYLDQAIDYAKNAGLKFEILWFGTDTCSLSTDERVPQFVFSNYQKTLDDNEAHTPLFKKNSVSGMTTGLYMYNMCKNDVGLREKEAAALKAVFDHIAERNDHVVIGCQVSNEPGVGLLHGSRMTPYCMCEVCTAKKKNLGVDEAEFREITMWEYNNNLAKAVKDSKYPVWTRCNLAESADVEGVAYNEKMRNSENGTYLDFIGIDHYRKTPSQLATEGIKGNQFAQGKNLTMLMELGQKDARENGLYLAEDVLATLSGGAFVTIYDASSSDGCEIYSYDQNTKTFSR